MLQHDSSLAVIGTAQAYPGEPISSPDLVRHIDKQFGLKLSRKARALAHRFNIHHRHIARNFFIRAEGTKAGCSNAELGAQALQQALREANLAVNDLGYLIGHTATPSELLPSNISQVAHLLNYSGPVAEFRQACTGFINALLFAAGICESHKNRAVAIVGSETGSVFFDPIRAQEDSAQLINMMQMGDGAGAIILMKDHSDHSSRIQHFFHDRLPGNYKSGLRLAIGGSMQPYLPSSSKNVLEFEHDFNAIRLHGMELFKAAINTAQAQGIDIAMMDAILPHQANGYMDKWLAPYLPSGKKIVVHADQIGNTGSAAIWLGLDHARRNILKPNQSLLALGVESTNYSYGGFVYEHR